MPYHVTVLDPPLTAVRYSTRPFPPYRFVPGRFPHPTAHPSGHSYIAPGHPHPRAKLVAAEQWRDSEDYLHGCDLYNYGYWWEAHEAWEALWQVTDKRETQGRFLQALIQVSACHMKLFEGKIEGVRSLLASSDGHMRFVFERIGSRRFMGMAFERWCDGVRRYYRQRAGAAGGGHDVVSYPTIVLAADGAACS